MRSTRIQEQASRYFSGIVCSLDRSARHAGGGTGGAVSLAACRAFRPLGLSIRVTAPVGTRWFELVRPRGHSVRACSGDPPSYGVGRHLMFAIWQEVWNEEEIVMSTSVRRVCA